MSTFRFTPFAPAAALAATLVCATAWADARPTVEFSIPAQPLSTALIEFASQAKVQVLTAGQEVKGANAATVDGRMTLDGALDRLLKGSGFTYRFVDPKTITIVKSAGPARETQTGARSDDPAEGLRLVSATTAPAAQPAAAPQSEPGRREAEGEGTDMVIFGERIVTRNREDTVEPVLVYSAGYFERFEPLTLNDMLKRVPGVYFDKLFNLPASPTGGTFADTTGTMPRFRNLDSQFSQILINGRRIAGIDFGSGGDAFLQTIPAESIKEIRVIRSPSAAIDSSGVGMTLDVILKNGSTHSDNSWRMAGAYLDHEMEPMGSVNMRRSFDRWSYSLTATAQNRYGSGLSVLDSDSDTVLTLPGFVSATRTLTQARTDSTQRDEDRSVIGTLALDVGRTGKLGLEGKYVGTGYEATAVTYRDTDTTRTEQIDAQPPTTTRTLASTVANATSRKDSSNYGGAVTWSQNLGESINWNLLAGYDRTDFASAGATISNDAGTLYESAISSAEGTGQRYQLNNHLAWHIGGNHELRLGADLQKTTELNYNANRTNFNSTPGNGFDTIFSQDYQETRRTDLFTVYEWRPANGLSLQVGARHETSDYDSNSPPQLVMTATVRQAFQFDPAVLDPTARTPFSARVSGFNPSAHLRWSVTANQDFRFSVARTVRRPHLGELDPLVYITASHNGSLTNEVQVGNPALKNEESLGFDAGYDWRFTDGIIGVNVFHRDIENLIEDTIISSERFAELRPDLVSEIQRFALFMNQNFPLGGPVLTTSPVNTARSTRVYGVELDTSLPLNFISPNAHLYANATWSNRKTSGQPGVEGSAVNVSYDHVLEAIGFTYGLGMNWITRSRSHSESLGSLIADTERKLEPNFELFVEKKFGASLLARLTMENATDALENRLDVNQFLGSSSGTQINRRKTQSDPRILFTVRGKF